MKEELAARFAESVTGVPRPEEWPPFAMPAAIAATLEEAARRDACPDAAVEYYTRKMPLLLVEQLRRDDPARELLWRPIGEAPKLRQALAGMFRVLGEEGISARSFVGADSPDELLRARPNIASLYAFSLFGSGLPLLGAYPGERAAYDLTDPDRELDLKLSGNLVHELSHGPPAAHQSERPLPWMIAEAAAITLGVAARPAHIFPDEPGEAVPGVSLFVCLGSALARRWGRGALFRLLAGAPLESATDRAEALYDAAWRDWLARREPPFARDAMGAMDWIKLAEGGIRPWPELPWWQEEGFTVEEVAEAVEAMFVVNVLAPNFQTHPAESPELHLDVEACTLSAPKKSQGVFGEPAWYLLPPPLCRRLWERGARRVRIGGTSRAKRRELAGALIEFATENKPLPEMVEWTCSP